MTLKPYGFSLSKCHSDAISRNETLQTLINQIAKTSIINQVPRTHLDYIFRNITQNKQQRFLIS